MDCTTEQIMFVCVWSVVWHTRCGVVSARFILSNLRSQDENPAFAWSFWRNQRTSWSDTKVAVEDFGNNRRKAEKQDEFPAIPRKTHVGILLSWTNGLSHRIAGKNRTVQVYIREESRNMRYVEHLTPRTSRPSHYFFIYELMEVMPRNEAIVKPFLFVFWHDTWHAIR